MLDQHLTDEMEIAVIGVGSSLEVVLRRAGQPILESLTLAARLSG